MNEKKHDRLKAAQRILPIITSVLAVLFGIAYIAAAAHIFFTGDYTRARVGEHLLWLLPITVLLICSVIASAVLCHGEKEPKGTRERTKLTAPHPRILLATRITVAVLALALIICGIIFGGMNDVLGKAVKICTECIGLG